MRFRLQLITIQENGQEQVQELAELARPEELRPETTGLTLAESKQLLKAIQQTVIGKQVETHLAGQRSCAVCGQTRSLKGHQEIKLQTVVFVKFRNLEWGRTEPLKPTKLYVCGS